MPIRNFINADTVDGFHASQTPTPNTIPVANNNGKISIDWLPQGIGSNLNADKVDGYNASQTPAPNTLLPLNANARIYDYVPKGRIVFDPPDFTMTNNTEYFVGSVNITTPSWSPSGAWKLMFVVKSYFYSASSGVNSFIQRIKTTSYVLDGAFWLWNAPVNSGIGVGDCFLIPDLSNRTTQQFSFYAAQGSATANAVFQLMVVEWYLFPA